MKKIRTGHATTVIFSICQEYMEFDTDKLQPTSEAHHTPYPYTLNWESAVPPKGKNILRFESLNI